MDDFLTRDEVYHVTLGYKITLYASNILIIIIVPRVIIDLGGTS